MFEEVQFPEDTRTEERRAEVRPPGTVSPALLFDLCTSCADCVAVCPQSIIVLDRDGLPVLTALGKCGNCGLCADVCMHGAIDFTAATDDGLKRTLAREREDGFLVT